MATNFNQSATTFRKITTTHQNFDNQHDVSPQHSPRNTSRHPSPQPSPQKTQQFSVHNGIMVIHKSTYDQQFDTIEKKFKLFLIYYSVYEQLVKKVTTSNFPLPNPHHATLDVYAVCDAVIESEQPQTVVFAYQQQTKSGPHKCTLSINVPTAKAILASGILVTYNYAVSPLSREDLVREIMVLKKLITDVYQKLETLVAQYTGA
eukprot:UN01783